MVIRICPAFGGAAAMSAAGRRPALQAHSVLVVHAGNEDQRQ
jgi:hypothetical protein